MSKSKSAYLEKEGPWIGILLLPSMPIIDQMKLAGETPPSIHLKAIIDTGAESSSISVSCLEELKLLPRNLRFRVSTGGKILCPVYDTIVQIRFTNMIDPVNFQLEVAGLDLDNYGISALIGRDILRHCELNYNGKLGTHSLTFIGDPLAKNSQHF